jgi:GNAT superfamily N-acetyltransferase
LDQAARAARMLTQAFWEDPVITHYLDDPERRRLAFPAFFRGAIFDGFDSGYIYGAWEGNRLAGCALWIPPSGQVQASSALAIRSKRAFRTVERLFPDTVGPLYAGFGALGTSHPAEPHWYLAFVGVDPKRQGKGIGARLLAPVLELADAKKELCYLETPFPQTHAFYRRLGFELGPQLFPFEGAAGIWTMVRKPR